MGNKVFGFLGIVIGGIFALVVISSSLTSGGSSIASVSRYFAPILLILGFVGTRIPFFVLFWWVAILT